MALLDRRQFLASATALASGCGKSEDTRPPNVLFVLADQWRSSAFGFGSDTVVRTPHFDRLAREGANWSRAYAANPVCTPNRACILTGRYSHQTGMIRNDIQLPPGELCWPQLLRDAGYATHYIGKWHLDGPPKPGYVPPGWRRRGFAGFEGFNRGHIYHSPWGFSDEGSPIEDLVADSPEPYFEPTWQTDRAIDFMRTNSDRPFACFLSWGPPHTPFKPPATFQNYRPDDVELRPNVPADHADQARKDLAGYYGLCEALDHEVGRLTGFLGESGLDQSTLVIFTSDHGELAGSHGKYRKGEPEDESLRVPLLMRLPTIIPGAFEPGSLINSVDLMPTLLTLCGLPTPSSCAGVDLSGTLVAGQEPAGVDSVYCEGKLGNRANAQATRNSPLNGPWRTIVTNRHKLVVRADHDTVESLFDLVEDPFEMRNLAGEPESATLQTDLLAELREWGRRTGDPFPGKPPAARESYDDPAG